MNPLSSWWLVRRLKSRGRVLKRVIRALKWFMPMMRDVIRGDFRPVPWRAFGLMALALAYLIMPFDLIPDFLVLVGLLDDVMIVGWLLNGVDRQLETYRLWKQNKDKQNTPPSDA
ncbi:YkvA family protein [Halomonas vilamensis]|uniref:YkvA family protein n=1 Tax=Vreelandella vilamensis TaxID=531309 RepID=A0ABU1H376_9GAMM|nr:YkvA family protein [Halomonas vilamensis]MDR5898122.1 YkvA family protein [Halomonas vilamensis]